MSRLVPTPSVIVFVILSALGGGLTAAAASNSTGPMPADSTAPFPKPASYSAPEGAALSADGLVAVPELLRQAQAKAAAGEYRSAAELLGRVVALNPVHAGHWYALGDARYHAKDYPAAIAAYQRAAELGAPMMGAYYSVYNVARCHALLGQREEAMASLERAFALGFPEFHRPAADEDLASLRDDPRFKRLLGLEDVSRMSRDEGWRYDLLILAGEVRRKGFNPHLYVNRPISREAFDAEVQKLHDAIPTLTDGQIILGMMRLIASLQDGHSAVWDFGEHPLFRAALPLRMFLFEEGLFVVAADPRYEALLGVQVVAFDGRPVEEVFDALRPYVNRDRGNPMKDKSRLPYAVRMLGVLHAAGLIVSPDRVTLGIRTAEGVRRDVAVEADAREPNIWNTLPAPASWVTLASKLPDPPLYLRNVGKAQWFEYLAEPKVVYIGFNRVGNDRNGGETLAQFTERLMAFVEANEVDKLVLDLRWNNGGNTALCHPLLLALVGSEKVNQQGRLFVIVGRRTYSAAQNMATYLERYTNATFVGEPTGSSPNFVGEEVPVTLPYSKVVANISHLFWQSSWPQDQRIWLAPQVYVPPTFADYREGRDRAMEAIFAYPAPPRNR